MNQWERNEIRFFRVLTAIALSLVGVCLVAALTIGIASWRSRRMADVTVSEAGAEVQEDAALGVARVGDDRFLPKTQDMGQEYIDQMVFVGESTTAHLRSRGVLRDGQGTEQVWSDSSGTMTLDLNILHKTILHPKTRQPLTIAQAAGREKPRYLVLSFGVNGIVGFSRNEELYRRAYGKLITAIHEASPDTVVLLQTVYPVADNQTVFGEGAATVNGYIRRINELLPEIADQYDAYVVDTASVLCDAQGNLRMDYQAGDGIHLTAEAYRQILQYLRTHGYEGEEGREE